MDYLVEKKHRFHIPSVENNTPLTYLQSDFYKIFQLINLKNTWMNEPLGASVGDIWNAL